ncbi:MAG: phosphatase PAP2 family protein [Sphaerochaetaceae bacterium]|nr:phosphatase PAP2 family protein [Sphaerochaetaceae bacterium]
MRKLTKKEFPYVFMSVALALLCNQIIYQDTRLITRYFHHWDIATPLDHTFRLIPWTLIIYFGCFAFWGISYAIIALQDDRQKSEQFFSAVAVSKILVMIMFLVFPTTADIRPEITGNSFWDVLYRNLYAIDPCDNYFPSIHCMVSWFCYIGVRGKKEFPLAWRIFACLMAFAVFFSTITTRQHVLVDIAGGIVFAELGNAIASRFEGVQRTYTKVSTWIMVHIFRKKGLEA